MTAPIRPSSQFDPRNNPISPNRVQAGNRRTIQSVNAPGLNTPAKVDPKVAPMPIQNQAPQAAPIPTTSQQGSGGTVGLTPTDPKNPLTGQTITPGETADRFALAQQKFDQFTATTDPAYQAALRQANRLGAAQGRLFSGSLRTDFGNLADQRNQQMDLARQGFLTDALEGTIGDAWKAIGLAERQQGFQNEQQEQAWRRALDRYGIGMTSNPSGAYQDLSSTYNQMAGQGQSYLDRLIAAQNRGG